jgi:hypothetical protein
MSATGRWSDSVVSSSPTYAVLSRAQAVRSMPIRKLVFAKVQPLLDYSLLFGNK